MRTFNFGKTIQIAAIAAAFALGVSGTAAFADTLTVSYLAPGGPTGQNQSQTNSPGHTYFVEDFDGSFNGTTTYGGSGITGTYTGDYVIDAANQYGGAGGTGKYIWPPFSGSGPKSYTVSLSQGVNYFGYWLSAQDPGDQLEIYSGANLLLTFTAADLSAGIGTCSTAGGYCGNPNATFLGQTPTANYAFVNFYLSGGGTFDKLVFTELNANNGYESDNHTVANLTSAPTGTVLSNTSIPSAVPEPSSLVLLGTGVLGVAGSLRRKLKR